MKNLHELQKALWAKCNSSGNLVIQGGEKSIKMVNSDGTGEQLVRQNQFGADLIRFAKGKGVGNHIHEGDHILFVLKGKGKVILNGIEHDLFPGLCYFIPGSIEHAIIATDELILIAVGNKHQSLDSNDRMTPVSHK